MDFELFSAARPVSGTEMRVLQCDGQHAAILTLRKALVSRGIFGVTRKSSYITVRGWAPLQLEPLVHCEDVRVICRGKKNSVCSTALLPSEVRMVLFSFAKRALLCERFLEGIRFYSG